MKDSEKGWQVSTNEDALWAYNCRDCVYTREVGEVLNQVTGAMGLSAVDAQQQRLFYPVLKAMLRGVRVLPKIKEQMAADIQEELSHRQAFLFNVLGHQINPRSPKQMQALFYEDLQQRPILNRTVVKGRTVMRPSVDDEALQKIAAREPLLRSICNAIADIRTLEKFHNDFVMMPLDEDGRMRCSFNIAGDAGGKSAPYSYRLSSSKNSFGSGGNLQTIPSEKSKSVGKAAARGSMDFKLPNIRAIYAPDPGFTFFDMDLDRADLQVVVWESDEPEWKAAMRMGVDMHLLNVYGLDNVEPPPLEELVESHPRYPDHRGPRKHKREFAKVFCHATNYLGGAKTVAEHTGRSVHEVDQAQKRWFAAHPGIKRWHERVLTQITKYRFIENRWGYRWYIFDRLDGILKDAVAWVPQSTVGILINKIWIQFYEQLPEVQVLLQVHDSLAGQLPSHRVQSLLPKMQELSRIQIPYDDPLIIPTGIKTSDVSWGDCA
jgi:DNA polymerase I-like protein with 3'-5' exonuclease and polymerase domains